MSIEHVAEELHPNKHSNNNNGWDRKPAPAIAIALDVKHARCRHIIEQLRRLLAHRTFGTDERILGRAERIARLIDEHRALVTDVLRLELL